MKNNIKNFGKVLDTLLDVSSDLKTLAQNSGLDVFKFYQGADLTGLPVGGSDLRGLSFERADLRGAILEDIIFDLGAFNGAKLDNKYAWLEDEFEFYLDDVFSARRFGLYFYGAFRPYTLEIALDKTGLKYQDFASKCKLTKDTLRKARCGKVMAGDTIVSICSTLLEEWERVGFDDLSDKDSRVRQPFIEFLDRSNADGFLHISRSDFLKVYRSKIAEEAESGPLDPPKYRSTFMMEYWLMENQLMMGF